MSETGSLMKEHLANASDYYQQTRKVILDGLAKQPAKADDISALAGDIYANVLLAAHEVAGVVGIAQDVLADDAVLLQRRHKAVWEKINQMPSLVEDRLRFVMLMGQSLPLLTSAIDLLAEMEEKRFHNSKVRLSKIN